MDDLSFEKEWATVQTQPVKDRFIDSDRAETIPADVQTDRGGLVKDEKPMGYSARQNETARKAAGGELLSRRTIIGAMDHALELHASALRLLEAKIVSVKADSEALRQDVARLVERLEELSQNASVAGHSVVDGGTVGRGRNKSD